MQLHLLSVRRFSWIFSYDASDDDSVCSVCLSAASVQNVQDDSIKRGHIMVFGVSVD